MVLGAILLRRVQAMTRWVTSKRFITCTLLSLTVGVLVGMVCSRMPASGSETEQSAASGLTSQDYFHFRFPVAVATDASKDVEEMATELAKTIGSFVWKTERNPGCALWVEQDNFMQLSPPQDGYVIRVGAGGGVFYFSSAEAGRLGMERLKGLVKYENGTPLVPLGVLPMTR